ncbi:MAG: hypothetical protein WCN92_07860 [Eubacteriales bacterium]
MPWNFGFYGKGVDGYVHYKQSFDEINKNGGGGNCSPGNGGKGKWGFAAVAGFLLSLWILNSIFQ